jgi:hypothetical protein
MKFWSKDKPIRQKEIKKTALNIIRIAQLQGKENFDLPIDTNMGKFTISVEIKEFAAE